MPTPAAHWTFDDGTGTTAIDSSGNGHTATLGTGVSWIAGNVGTNAIGVNGSSAAVATVTGPVVNTAASFTVSAWVKLNAISGYQTVVSIAGTNVAGFFLGLRGDTGSFSFARIPSDSLVNATIAASTTAPVAGTWYHIVGVDDVTAGTLSIYVDGQLMGTAAFAGGWAANGNTLIGHGFYNGARPTTLAARSTKWNFSLRRFRPIRLQHSTNRLLTLLTMAQGPLPPTIPDTATLLRLALAQLGWQERLVRTRWP